MVNSFEKNWFGLYGFLRLFYEICYRCCVRSRKRVNRENGWEIESFSEIFDEKNECG